MYLSLGKTHNSYSEKMTAFSFLGSEQSLTKKITLAFETMTFMVFRAQLYA